MTDISILTPRLVIRTPREEDIPAVQRAKEEIWNELQLWMSWAHADQKSVEALQAYYKAAIAKSPYESLWAFRRDDGAFAVSTGLPATDEAGVFITGYWAAKAQTGQGFATEATNAVVRYAFGALKANTVLIDYYEGNEKSSKIIHKLGFKPMLVLRKYQKRCLDGAPLDVHKFKRTDANGLPPLDVSW